VTGAAGNETNLGPAFEQREPLLTPLRQDPSRALPMKRLPADDDPDDMYVAL